MGLHVELIDERGRCACCGRGEEQVFSANVTHNLASMAEQAGLYGPVWRPEKQGLTHARDLIPHLERGITQMELAPDRFRAYSSPNGYGTYDGFLSWLRRYLGACRQHPDARVEVDR